MKNLELSDNRTAKIIGGQAAEYRVMSELLLRGIRAALVGDPRFPCYDIITFGGQRIQVRSRGVNKTGHLTFSLQRKAEFEFLILWIRPTDYFYIIPYQLVNGLGGISLKLEKPGKYNKFLNRWDLIKA